MNSRASVRLSLTLFVIVLALAGPLNAQEALTQTADLTLDGLTMTVSYPDGWVAETNDVDLFVASSAAAMQDIHAKGTITSAGELGMFLSFSTTLSDRGLPLDAPPAETVTAFLESAALEGNIKERRDFNVPAATVVVTLPNETNTDVLVGALEHPEGTVLFAVLPNRLVDSTVLAVLNSITLTTGDSSDGETGAQALSFSLSQPNGTHDLTLTIPAGWVYEYSESRGYLYLGNTDSALEKASVPDGVFEAGEVALSLVLPVALEDMGLPLSDTPEDAIAGVINLFGVEGKILTDNSFGVPAAHAHLTGNTLPGGSGDVYALAFAAGILLIAIQPGGAVDDAVLEIFHSIQFGEPSETTNDTPQGDTIRQWAIDAEGSSQYGKESWSFRQATGEPDTADCGDNVTAWASESSIGTDFLTVSFDQPVIPSQINIYQTYNPGSIVMIDVGNSDNPDQVLTLPDSADPPGNTDCPGVFSLDVSGVDMPIDFVVIYLDQSIGGSWNEIDAVELVGTPAE